MAYYTTPMTQLEAVNIVLSSIGEPPVNAIAGSGVDAQMASDVIDEVSRSVQLKGWHWNKEIHTLSPDVNGNLVLPGNTAKVDSTRTSANIDVVQRGLKLYNRDDNTYTFTTNITLELYVYLIFDELPAAARDCIAARAALLAQQRVLGSDTLDGFLKMRDKESWAELVRDEMLVADPNMLRDNWSTLGIVQRGWFGRYAYQSGTR